MSVTSPSLVDQMRAASLKAMEEAEAKKETEAARSAPQPPPLRQPGRQLVAAMEALAASEGQVRQGTTTEVSFGSGKVSPQEERRPDMPPPPVEEPDTMRYTGTAYDNPEVRKAIESRCTKMDFSDLVITGRVVQRVPIIPGKLEVEFQSLRGEEHWWLNKVAPSKSDYGFTVQMWLEYGALVMSLKEFNGSQYDSAWDVQKRTVDADRFYAKWEAVMGLSSDLLALLVVNLGWFRDRVTQLYRNDFKLLKNG